MTGQHEDPQHELEIHPALSGYRESAHRAFPPPPAESVVARAMRRRRLTVGAAVAAAVVMAGATSIVTSPSVHPAGMPPTTPTPAAVTPPMPVPSSSATSYPVTTLTAYPPTAPAGTPVTSPKNVVIADAALLQPQDLGPGFTATADHSYGWMQEWGLRAAFDGCPHLWQEFTGPYPQNGDIAVRLDGPKRVSQHVSITGAARAAWQLNNIRATVAACADFQRQERHITIRLLDEGFTADQSMLIELVIDDGFSRTTRLHVFARRGAAYTEIAMAADAEQLKSLSGRAVERMCTALAC